VASRVRPTERPGSWAAALLILLASIGTHGCFEGANCTPADTTHGCCVKNNPTTPEACDGIEGVEGTAFRRSSTIKLVSTEEEQHLIRRGRKHELKGTLKPDVVIHSGDPTQARLVYDFKYPCGNDKPPTWRIYKQGAYRDSTQGERYKEALGVQPGRVVPGKKGVIR
jgi:hypothetical protein